MSSIATLLDIVSSGIFTLTIRKYFDDVSAVVNYQFIDEIFHYPQFQLIYEGDYHTWDPKITTPPGLYYLTVLLLKLLKLDPTLENARFINYLGGCVLVSLVYLIRQKVRSPGFTSASILLNPLLALFYSLYYTDVWSSTIIVAAYAVIVFRPFNNLVITAWLSAALGLLSLTFRQTNIAWCIFLLAVIIDDKVKDDDLYKYQQGHGDFVIFLKTALKNYSVLIPYAIIGIIFLIFVYLNGGVPLGDKDNHVVVPHLAQLCYCATFITLFTVPIWFSIDIFSDYITDNLFSVQALFFNAAWIPTLYIMIENFTIIHPFILADNRHYTFYLVRKFITRTQNSRLEIIPIYHFSFYIIYKLFIQSSNIGQKNNRSEASPILFIFYIFSTFVSIALSPLIEPRYYILPYIIFRLFVRPSDKPVFNNFYLKKYNTALRYTGELIWLWFWTQTIYTIFLNYNFPWADLDTPQRIIW